MYYRWRRWRSTPPRDDRRQNYPAGAGCTGYFKQLQSLDSLLSIVQMPKGIPVATFAIGEAGAANAGLFAIALLALSDPTMAEQLEAFRKMQAEKVKAMTLPKL